MNEQIAIDVVQEALRVIIVASAPPLLAGLIIGLVISIFQSITSIQDATLSFVPKIIVVLLSLIVFGPFILATVTDFMSILWGGMTDFIR